MAGTSKAKGLHNYIRSSTASQIQTPITIFVLLSVVLLATSVDAAPSHEKEPDCPPKHEIFPCLCRQMGGAPRGRLPPPHSPTSSLLTCQETNTKRLVDILASVRRESNRIRSIKVVQSDLLSIPDGAFSGLEVEQMILVESNVSKIADKALAALKESLKELVLDSNRLKQVPTDSLSYLTSLKTLDLSNNKIEKIENYAFSGLHNLEELRLGSNDIAHIDSLAFDDCCRNLDTLNMANNLLTTIPSDSFAPLGNLSVLKLDGNIIKIINPNAFPGLTQLNTIDLSNNLISSVSDDAFASCSAHSIILKNNDLVHIPASAFEGVGGSTEWLDLSYNHFDKVPTEALRRFRVLRHLDLSHNKVAQIDDNSMMPFGRALRYIELNNNNMRHISSIALQELNSVEFLMLAHNNITEMKSEAVELILDTIYLLDLSDNPLVCGCDLQWLKEWLDTVSTLERLTPDPTCFMEGTQHMQFVRQITCDHKTGKQTTSDPRLCLDAGCVKSLGTFFSKQIRWY